MMTRSINRQEIVNPSRTMSMARDRAPFDLWLESELKREHGEVMQERLPDELRALVERFS